MHMVYSECVTIHLPSEKCACDIYICIVITIHGLKYKKSDTMKFCHVNPYCEVYYHIWWHYVAICYWNVFEETHPYLIDFSRKAQKLGVQALMWVENIKRGNIRWAKLLQFSHFQKYFECFSMTISTSL